MAAHSLKPSPTASSQSILWFGATTLLGAFLVFQVQPIISKCVLPWFGGTPAVWTTCMLFFQLLLFAGYLYAHLLRSIFPPTTQGCIHLLLLAAAAFALPIEPADSWKPTGNESPTAYLLWMLATHVGLPYFVLSSTGPLIQAWLSYQDNSDRVYRLYALSNAGSLVALLSYPFVVEPALSLTGQSTIWSLMFCAFVLFQGVIAIRLFRVQESEPASGPTLCESEKTRPNVLARCSWIMLPAIASTLLLVVTNHVCQDVAVIPFLWVLPLSLYLLSFIISFDSPNWYKPKWIAGITLLAIMLIQGKSLLPNSTQLVAEATCFMVMLLGVCLLCHGEVARLKPASQHLTTYYAMLSAGGAMGGLIVAVACPLLLNSFAELPFMLSLVSAISFMYFFACKRWNEIDYDWSVIRRLGFAAIILMVAPFVTVAVTANGKTVASQRNFFGVLRVQQDESGISLVHGSTLHGKQRPAPHANQPTTYYGLESGIGRTFRILQSSQDSMRVGVVGLGCGVLATYGRSTDHFDMIEINPAVFEIAQQHFSFMENCPSTIENQLGDGRLVLERLKDTRYDLLVLDAFSSDAIPAHLLTRESMSLYRNRLTPGGVLAIHVSNNHLDLVPLVHRLAHDNDLVSRVMRVGGNESICTKHSTWMLITADVEHLLWHHPLLTGAVAATPAELQRAPIWTDQHHNLVSVLRLW